MLIWKKPSDGKRLRYYHKNSGAINAALRPIARKKHLKRKFGLSLEQYDRLLEVQGGCCAIYHSSTPRRGRQKHFAIDHNHKTGETRGLLCHPCNAALGFLKEDPEILWSMLYYIGVYNVG
jgi:Autographiviridae endonuclease VII